MLLVAQAAGKQIKALDDKPEDLGNLVWFYNVFHALSGSRPQGMGGSGPIPVSEVLAYCQLINMDDIDDRLMLLGFISKMDSVWLKHQEKVQKAAEEKSKRKSK